MPHVHAPTHVYARDAPVLAPPLPTGPCSGVCIGRCVGSRAGTGDRAGAVDVGRESFGIAFMLYVLELCREGRGGEIGFTWRVCGGLMYVYWIRERAGKGLTLSCGFMKEKGCAAHAIGMLLRLVVGVWQEEWLAWTCVLPFRLIIPYLGIWVALDEHLHR